MPTIATKPADDSKLLQLGRQAAALEAWLDKRELDTRPVEGDREFARAMDQHGELLGRIVAMPAGTIEGMRVKAARIAHWHAAQGEQDDDAHDADVMLALSLVRDLVPAPTKP